MSNDNFIFTNEMNPQHRKLIFIKWLNHTTLKDPLTETGIRWDTIGTVNEVYRSKTEDGRSYIKAIRIGCSICHINQSPNGEFQCYNNIDVDDLAGVAEASNGMIAGIAVLKKDSTTPELLYLFNKKQLEKRKHEIDEEFHKRIEERRKDFLENRYHNWIKQVHPIHLQNCLDNHEKQIDMEEYILFTCVQANIIAQSLDTKEEILALKSDPWETVMKKIPRISEDHSGNTFNMAVNGAIEIKEYENTQKKSN